MSLFSERHTRRSFLLGLSGAAAVAVAGCGTSAVTNGVVNPSPTWTPTPQPTVKPGDPPLKISRDKTYIVGRPMVIPYGKNKARQYGELYVPQGLPKKVKVPVVMMIHGGSWKDASTLNYMRPMAENIASYGIAVWNIEYRGIYGDGGWPETFIDVATAMDKVPGLAQHIGRDIDRRRFFITGHSAGGHLAAWAASRHVRGAKQPGGRPVLRPEACVSYAGVYDLKYAQTNGHKFMVSLLGGTPEQFPARYELASPIRNIPHDVRIVCCHGSHDSVVPIAQMYNYAAAAERSGDSVETVVLVDAEHLEWTDPQAYAYVLGQQTLLDAIGVA